MEKSCGVLLRQLQHIWAEIGISKQEQDKVLIEIDRECLQVHQRKVDEAICSKSRLHLLVAAKEAEISAIFASLGEQLPYSQVPLLADRPTRPPLKTLVVANNR